MKTWTTIYQVKMGLGTITDLAMVSGVICFLLIVLWFRWQNLWWCTLIVSLPLILYVTTSLIQAGDAFWFDLAFVRSRLQGGGWFDQLWLVADNYTRLISQHSWFALGIVGLWLLPQQKERTLVILALVFPLIILGRTAPLVELSFYYILWLLPLIALGVGALICAAVRYWQTTIPQPPLRWAALAGFIVIPILLTIVLTHGRIQTSYGTVIDPFLLSSHDVLHVTEFVNQHSDLDDVIIASPAVGWRLKSNTADFQMAIAATGIRTPHLPADLPKERYRFDPSFQQARYVIIDDLWRTWGRIHVPTLSQEMAKIEQWPILVRSGNITVYENPQTICARSYQSQCETQ